MDTMTLEMSRKELAKMYTEDDEKENDGFRFVIGKDSLRRVLMFRGSSIDVSKVQLFKKS